MSVVSDIYVFSIYVYFTSLNVFYVTQYYKWNSVLNLIVNYRLYEVDFTYEQYYLDIFINLMFRFIELI